jgi:hypothetical protein
VPAPGGTFVPDKKEAAMVTLLSLWLPILVSAVLVFVASSVIHMVLGYHANDLRQLPQQDQAMDALRPLGIAPGDYSLPRAGSLKAMKDPDYIEKLNRGPVVLMTVLPNGPVAMGKSLFLWFVYSLVVSIFAGYVASRAVPAGGDYLSVFRFAGVTAFAGYALALWQGTIWYKRSVATTLKSNLDGLIYACLTAGTFGWLWPR